MYRKRAPNGFDPTAGASPAKGPVPAERSQEVDGVSSRGRGAVGSAPIHHVVAWLAFPTPRRAPPEYDAPSMLPSSSTPAATPHSRPCEKYQ